MKPLAGAESLLRILDQTEACLNGRDQRYQHKLASLMDLVTNGTYLIITMAVIQNNITEQVKLILNQADRGQLLNGEHLLTEAEKWSCMPLTLILIIVPTMRIRLFMLEMLLLIVMAQYLIQAPEPGRAIVMGKYLMMESGMLPDLAEEER